MESKTKHDTHCFASLVQLIGLLQTREVISSWFGSKVARIGIEPTSLKKVCDLLRELKLHIHVDAEAMFLKRDIGKGGWSNKFADENGPGSEHKTVIIYISRRKSSLSLAVKSDKGGDDGEFGTQLGIPDCCIGFYLENREKAYTKQNDFVSLVYQNTKELTSFNFWNNFVSQYFGYSLLSHFPCSFNCMRSASLAMNCFEEVRNVLPEQAEKTKYYQKQPILYTEYRGVYMFENGKTYGDTTYINDCIIHSTLNENAKTAKYVLSLASIRILSKKTICLTSKNGDEKTVSNSNYAMCTFDENF